VHPTAASASTIAIKTMETRFVVIISPLSGQAAALKLAAIGPRTDLEPGKRLLLE
jgi:hypothetical protein